MSEIVFIPNEEAFKIFPCIIARQTVENNRKITDYICTINNKSCISARGGLQSGIAPEIVAIVPTSEIPGCRVGCPVFEENCKKLQSKSNPGQQD